MRFQAALVAAATVTSTSAFLITPDIANAISEAKTTFTHLVLGATQSVDVQCHECPAFVAHEEKAGHPAGRYGVIKDTIKSTIHLDFSTKSGMLQINNETVFPLEAVNNKFPKLTAHQTRLDTGEDLVTVPIDFLLSSQKVERPRRHPNRFGHIQEAEPELFTVDFTVIGLAGWPVKSQTAHADLVAHSGVYTLARLRTSEFNPTAPGEDDLKVCQNARNVQLCRVRLIANRKLREMMQGALERAQFIKEWMKNHGPGNKARPCHNSMSNRIGTMHNGQRYQHGKHGQHGQHGHKHHRYLHVALVLVKALVIPAVLGFAVGFTVSAVGMLVGQFIVFLWTRFYRGHRGPKRNHGEISLEDGEKEGLMAEGENPPAYEYCDEAPAYEAANVKSESHE